MSVSITPEMAIALVTLGTEITRGITAQIRANRGDDTYQPTDAEVIAELKKNAADVVAEGEAWKREHPAP